jgi:hypothetical protein
VNNGPPWGGPFPFEISLEPWQLTQETLDNELDVEFAVAEDTRA